MKYFSGLCDGQLLSESAATAAKGTNVPFHIKHAKQIGIAIPFLLVHFIWWFFMIKTDSFSVFTNKVGAEQTSPYMMSITMVFGSMLAGATSEGGAAVAFPIMTLVFGIAPAVARDFSFMIQSVGMTAAAFTILWMKVQVEWKSIIYCSIGGIVGCCYGLEKVAPELTPPYSKMYFVTIWASFAGSLFWLNRLEGRKVYLTMNPSHLPEIWNSANLIPRFECLRSLVGNPIAEFFLNWKALTLILAGFVGGIFTAMSGSGIDICSFAVLTLLFRVSEKTATPTSVVLMGFNTLIAALYRNYVMDGLDESAWDFFTVCAPVVVLGAPLGSVLGSFFHRLVLASFVYITDTVQLVGALYVVRPWTDEKCNELTDCTPTHICLSSAALFLSGLTIFFLLQKWGQKLIEFNNGLEESDLKSRPEVKITTELKDPLQVSESLNPLKLEEFIVSAAENVESDELQTLKMAYDTVSATARSLEEKIELLESRSGWSQVATNEPFEERPTIPRSLSLSQGTQILADDPSTELVTNQIAVQEDLPTEP